MAPSGDEVGRYTDKYFARTRTVVERFGDCRVTYAVFMRRPVLSTPRLALDWLRRVVAERQAAVEVELLQQEGDWVGAGEPLMYLHGPFRHLVDLETVFLQRLGPACVAAYNAYTMCTDLPYAGFLAMDTRHCAGAEMAELMAYAASVGSARAQRETGAKGFIGNSTDATAHFFGQPSGLGTMPHALIGYAGSTLRAAEMFHATFPDDALTVLVDFFGREVTDSLEVCRHFPELAAAGRLSIRLDTHGGRFMEELDVAASYAVLERHVPHAIRTYRTSEELALAHRHRSDRSGHLPHARAAGRGRLRPGQDHSVLRVRAVQMQADGEREGSRRRDRHRLLPAGTLDRDLRHRRRHRL